MAAERGNSMTFADGSGANGSGTGSGYRSRLGACVWRGSAKLVAPSARGSCWAGNVEFCWARAGGVATAATPISAVPVPAEAIPAEPVPVEPVPAVPVGGAGRDQIGRAAGRERGEI